MVVVVAMPDEEAPFLDRADSVGGTVSLAGAVQHRLTLEGTDVLLVRSGIGLVNSATSAALALATGDGPAPAALISAGSAGGIGTQVRVGEVVVGTEYVYTGADARAFGYALGQVPGMPPTYTADPALLEAATTADPGDLTVRTGLMLSGDSFVDASLVDAVRTAFPAALSTDMETTALAQTSHRHGVPFLSVRGISDLCGPVADEDFLTHVDDAADRSATVVIGLLRQLAPVVA